MTWSSSDPFSPTAFADLVRRYQGLVCAVAYSATGDRAVGEEVAQEAFLIAWRKMPEMTEPPEMPAWLCGIARNLGRMRAARSGARSWTRRRIDLDMGDANAEDIIRLISDVAEVPIVVRGSIGPPVNMTFRQVAALDALDDLLEQVGATRTEIPVLRIVPGEARGADQLTGDPVTATFDQAPLAEVMTMMSEHLDLPITIDPALASTPITVRLRWHARRCRLRAHPPARRRRLRDRLRLRGPPRRGVSHADALAQTVEV